jgi:hypothetical protein
LGINPRGPRTGRFADFGHGVRSGDGGIEIREAFLNFLDQVFEADVLGSGGDGRFGSQALGEDGDADVAAGAVREGNGAPDHLVALPRVHAEVEGERDGGSEFGRRELLHGADCVGQGVALACLDESGCLLVAFAAVFGHCGVGWQFGRKTRDALPSCGCFGRLTPLAENWFE